MADSLEQLRVDLIWLAKRQKVIEDAFIGLEEALPEFAESIDEWSGFITKELLQNGVKVHKYKKSNEYFKASLKDKFKADYDKFEELFSRVKELQITKKPEYIIK